MTCFSHPDLCVYWGGCLTWKHNTNKLSPSVLKRRYTHPLISDYCARDAQCSDRHKKKSQQVEAVPNAIRKGDTACVSFGSVKQSCESLLCVCHKRGKKGNNLTLSLWSDVRMFLQKCHDRDEKFWLDTTALIVDATVKDTSLEDRLKKVRSHHLTRCRLQKAAGGMLVRSEIRDHHTAR